jgi:hypothetical protein
VKNPPQQQKPIEVVPIEPPPLSERVQRNAVFAGPDEKKTRYSLPTSLDTTSPVGYRTRVRLSLEEAKQALALLSMEHPSGFAAPGPVTEQELFEECSLGVLTSRQSTNYAGHKQVSLGPEESARIAELLRDCEGLDRAVLDNATHTHIVLSRPYRTPFTLLLTFIGHLPVVSLLTVPIRGLRKRFQQIDDIPTIGYLQQIHVGVLADTMERAAVIASNGTRRAQVIMAPFCRDRRAPNRAVRELEAMCGLTAGDRSRGWRVALVVQVGNALRDERVDLTEPLCRKLGANLLAFRSERIQPGVNQEEKAPAQYQKRQSMDVPDELTVMAGRAAYNAFAHWTSCDRERSKDLLLLERIDVLTPNGKTRLRQVRESLNSVTDTVLKRIPLWVDLPTGRAFSRNTRRGRKAFALAGQRIYITGLSRPEIATEGINWALACRALGAAAARSALVAELMGVTELPDGCDLLAGICMMAGPVNQNDIGKAFYGHDDLLAGEFPGREPTSLLVWTLKAKTVADPVGNEEQLMNATRQGALVDLRLGPHQAIKVSRGAALEPMRQRSGRLNSERAFSDVGNFVADAEGREIPGNRGSEWPKEWREEVLWAT